jgi:hypothetical protein
MNTQLPLVVELAEPKMIAGEVDIQLSSQTSSGGKSHTLNGIGLLSDLVNDVTVDDVIA